MTDMIPLADSNMGGHTIQTFNATDLYRELGVRKDRTDWIKQYAESSDWLENVDFVVFPLKGENPRGGRPVKGDSHG